MFKSRERKMQESKQIADRYDHAKLREVYAKEAYELSNEMQRLQYEIRIATGEKKEQLEEELREVNHKFHIITKKAEEHKRSSP